MEKSIVCVHGRSLQWQMEQQVLETFQDGITEGLGRLNEPASLITREQIVLAFYGDLFLPDVNNGEMIISPLSTKQSGSGGNANLDRQADFAKKLLQEAARRRLIDADTLKQTFVDEREDVFWDNVFVISILQALDKIAGAPRGLLRLFVSDADQYLHNTALRAQVMARLIDVLRQQQGKEIIIVAHSFGSVVAYDVLNTHPEFTVSAFVTLGSPLGLSPFIYDALLPVEQRPHLFPATITGSWNNFYDPYDITALVPQLAPLFPGTAGKAVITTGVTNDPDDHHSLTGYLIQLAVAQMLRNALVEGVSLKSAARGRGRISAE